MRLGFRGCECKTMTDMDYVKWKLLKRDLLAQLAEESAELAQAALKLHRKLTGTNPTPKTREECEAALLEEIADVMVCLDSLDVFKEPKIYSMMAVKTARWANRLKEGVTDAEHD